MCARVAEFKRSPFDLFYASPSTQVKSCRCRIKGQFKIRVVDLRLLNNDDICSGTYINIQKLEGCPTPNNCFNKSFHCSEAAGTKMIHQKEVYYTGSNSAKLEISLVQLDSPPQMVWFRIIPGMLVSFERNHKPHDHCLKYTERN